MAHWQVHMLCGAQGVPVQPDGKSCGVFSAVLCLSMLCHRPRRLPELTEETLKEWRAHMAHTILLTNPNVNLGFAS